MENRSFKSEYSMINYNGNLTSSLSATLDMSNRGFQYGDGVFETMIIENGNLKFFDEHWERLTEGVEDLKMKITFNKSRFLEMIEELLEQNNLMHKNVRAKFLIWRKTGGLYMPTETMSEFCLLMQELDKKPIQYFAKVEIAKNVKLYKSQWSHLKTISALPYVMAGIEKKERKLEELILLDQHGFIAEASASNIYFYDKKNNKLFTPSLQSGCINGVSRRYLFKNASKNKLKVEEAMWKPKDLYAGLSVFTINVAGINQILKIGSSQFSHESDGLDSIQSIIN